MSARRRLLLVIFVIVAVFAPKLIAQSPGNIAICLSQISTIANVAASSQSPRVENGRFTFRVSCENGFVMLDPMSANGVRQCLSSQLTPEGPLPVCQPANQPVVPGTGSGACPVYFDGQVGRNQLSKSYAVPLYNRPNNLPQIGDEVSFFCWDVTKLPLGSDVARCTANGWSPAMVSGDWPACIAKPALSIACREPANIEGTIQERQGNTARFRCIMDDYNQMGGGKIVANHWVEQKCFKFLNRPTPEWRWVSPGEAKLRCERKNAGNDPRSCYLKPDANLDVKAVQLRQGDSLSKEVYKHDSSLDVKCKSNMVDTNTNKVGQNTLVTIQCIDGIWSTAIPKCEPPAAVRTCNQDDITRQITGNPGISIRTTSRDPQPPSIGSYYTFSCPPEQRINGSATVFCSFLSSWNASVPRCENKVTCRAPQPLTNGRILNKDNVDPSRRSFYQGDLIQFECNSNYRLVDSNGNRAPPVQSCLANGRWSFTPPLRCERQSQPSCPTPVIYSGVYQINTGRIQEGTEAQFTCYQGWTLSGPGTSRCLSGSWSPAVPECQDVKECIVPQSLGANAARIVRVTDLQGIGVNYQSGNVDSERVAVYECQPGFSLAGNPQRRCLNGVWQGLAPNCFRDCTAPPSVSAGTWNEPSSPTPATKFQHDNTYVYRCPPNQEATGSVVNYCSNGKWQNEDWPKCGGGCPAPFIRFGSWRTADGTRPNRITDGEFVIYECNSQYELYNAQTNKPLLPIQSMRQAHCTNGQFDKVFYCEPVKCPTLQGNNLIVSPISHALSVGTVVTLRCQDGFRFATNRGQTIATTCRYVNNAAQWQPTLAPCVPAGGCEEVLGFDANVRSTYSNGKNRQNKFDLATKISFTCQRPLCEEIQNTFPQNTLTCIENNGAYTWDGNQPFLIATRIKCQPKSRCTFVSSDLIWDEESPQVCWTNPTSVVDGAKGKFRCRQGTLNGIADNECVGTRFKNPTPECVPDSGCPTPPKIPNAVPSVDGIRMGGLTTSFGDNAKLTYFCDTGYCLSGINREFTCLNKAWTPPIESTLCQAGCTNPDYNVKGIWTPVDASGSIKQTYCTADRLKLQCGTGFQKTTVTDTVITCRNGNWSPNPVTQFAECVAVKQDCLDPPKIDNGVVRTPTGVLRHVGLSDQILQLEEQQIEITCDAGFERNFDARFICKDGLWSPQSWPACVPRKCPTLQDVRNGISFSTTVDKSWRVGHTVTVTCPDNNAPSCATAKCLVTGQWDCIPTCPIKLNCPAIPQMTGRSAEQIYPPAPQTGLMVKPDTMFRISCITGYKMEMNEAEMAAVEQPSAVKNNALFIRCGVNGRWPINMPHCERVITCNPVSIEFGTWRPVEDSTQSFAALFQTGTQIRIECNNGYELASENGQPPQPIITCQNSGRWTTLPYCKPII